MTAYDVPHSRARLQPRGSRYLEPIISSPHGMGNKCPGLQGSEMLKNLEQLPGQATAAEVPLQYVT